MLGVCLIASSFEQMRTLEYTNYRYLFHTLPEWMFIVRFIGSWTLRILGLIGGVGILFGKDFARRIILGISMYTICTVFWKHPYQVVLRNMEKIPLKDYVVWGDIHASVFILFACYLLDIFFFGFVLWFLNRPDIKRQFTPLPRQAISVKDLG